MTDETLTDEDIDNAVARLATTRWEDTYCAAQDSFEVFTLGLRNTIKGELADTLSDLDAMPFGDVNRMMVIIGFGGPREGARALASFYDNGGREPLDRAVGYDELMRAFSESNTPGTEAHLALVAHLESIPVLNAVLASAGDSLVTTLASRFPVLADHTESLRFMVFTNLFSGVRLEFLIPRLAAGHSATAR